MGCRVGDEAGGRVTQGLRAGLADVHGLRWQNCTLSASVGRLSVQAPAQQSTTLGWSFSAVLSMCNGAATWM